MKYAICSVPAAPLRKEASHRVEMVNQLLFGETMQVLESKDEWLRIKTIHDEYEGWLTIHLIKEINEDQAKQHADYVSSELVNILNWKEQLINIPMGSSLIGFNEASKYLWNKDFQYNGQYSYTTHEWNNELFLKTCHSWLNAPYLWGGKTLMGVDCSGFVQTVFKVNGIQLLRDAWQQATQGEAVENRLNSKQCDLAFFHNDKGRITHVGIMLANDSIIHASGRVRIDKIDDEGIINVETGKRTHQLNSIRRFLK